MKILLNSTYKALRTGSSQSSKEIRVLTNALDAAQRRIDELQVDKNALHDREILWEKTMRDVIGEDGPGSVAGKIRGMMEQIHNQAETISRQQGQTRLLIEWARVAQELSVGGPDEAYEKVKSLKFEINGSPSVPYVTDPGHGTH